MGGNKMTNIVYENANKTHYVVNVKTGHYEVYCNKLTHAVRVSTAHLSNDPHGAFKRAVDRCDFLGRTNHL
jgi:hypothetical protein